MKKGEKVMLMWAAAARDPSEFPDPETIDIERTPNRPMAFGVGLHRFTPGLRRYPRTA
jgi:cytochrome P450